jgi:hypothetical protein
LDERCCQLLGWNNVRAASVEASLQRPASSCVPRRGAACQQEAGGRAARAHRRQARPWAALAKAAAAAKAAVLGAARRTPHGGGGGLGHGKGAPHKRPASRGPCRARLCSLAVAVAERGSSPPLLRRRLALAARPKARGKAKARIWRLCPSSRQGPVCLAARPVRLCPQASPVRLCPRASSGSSPKACACASAGRGRSGKPVPRQGRRSVGRNWSTSRTSWAARPSSRASGARRARSWSSGRRPSKVRGERGAANKAAALRCCARLCRRVCSRAAAARTTVRRP